MPDVRPLILASASAARQVMLRAAGLAIETVQSGIDERDLEARAPTMMPSETAALLAREKARSVSERRPATLVIGADQVLNDDLGMISKAATIDDARSVLQRLRGRAHRLTSACALAEDGAIVWEHMETVELAMRNFSDAFLEEYLAAVGPSARESAGAYKIEGLGIQLFEAIGGNHFVILGLPLLPLLAALRERGVLPT